MSKCIAIFSLSLLLTLQMFAQESYYNWDWEKEKYILGGSALFWSGSQFLKFNTDEVNTDDLLTLNPNDVWSFDRGALDNINANSAVLSDYLLFGTAALPFVHYLGTKGQGENWKIAGMAIETFLIAEGFVNVLKRTTTRFRPFTYNPAVPQEEKLTRGARFSFPSGHTAAVASLSFFSAKVFSDLYPESKWKPLVWSGAITLPALTAYFRFDAGRHFPTDVISGFAIGAAVGYLIPHVHRKNNNKNLSVLPSGNSLYLSYSF